MLCSSARLAAKAPNWNRTAMIAFACDAAEKLIPAFEEMNPKDQRLREALRAVRAFFQDPARPEPVRQSADAAHDAAEEARQRSYQDGCGNNACDIRLLDASRVAAAVAGIAKGVATHDVNDFRLFQVRANTADERQWQLERKLQYIHGKVKIV